MSKIKKIELFYIQIPLPTPITLAWLNQEQSYQRMNLIRLTTNDGLTGISAGWAMGPERKGLGSWLANSFLGMDPLNIDLASAKLKELKWQGLRNDWIEPAFWDIRGKIEQKPVYQLLQNEEKSVHTIPVYCSTMIHLPYEQRMKNIDIIQKMGFQGTKIRLTSQFDRDIDLCNKVRKHLHFDHAFMLDADQGKPRSNLSQPKWRLTQALDYISALQELRVDWLEEPIDMYDYDDLSVLRSESEIPIAGGEMNAGWQDFKAFMDKGSLDIYQPDATVTGGLSTTLRIMESCLQKDLHFTPSSGTNGISFLINLHLYAAWPLPFFYEFPYEPDLWTPHIRDAILEKPFEIDNLGHVRIPNEPGLGIYLNKDVMETYTTTWECLTA